MWRIARVIGASALGLGCSSSVSTSDYGVAATYAAAAGALQVAEAVYTDKHGPNCGPLTCDGCCDLTGHCLAGRDTDACGYRGTACRNCSPDDGEVCRDGACQRTTVTGPTSSTSSSIVSSPPPSPVRTQSPQCGKPVFYCFPGSTYVCETDATGCSSCSCVPDAKTVDPMWRLPN